MEYPLEELALSRRFRLLSFDECCKVQRYETLALRPVDEALLVRLDETDRGSPET